MQNMLQQSFTIIKCSKVHSLRMSTYVQSLSYKYIARPSVEYASTVWCLHATSDVNCLDAVQNRAAHWACGSRGI